MADFLQIVSALREQMHAAASRSDILRPLTWLVGLLLTATVSTIGLGGQPWLAVTLIIFLVPTLLLYLGAFVYCLLRNPDALRSERFAIQKMAIEHGIYGDSLTGTFDAKDVSPRAVESAAKEIGHGS